jgi:hypothetical protein
MKKGKVVWVNYSTGFRAIVARFHITVLKAFGIVFGKGGFF